MARRFTRVQFPRPKLRDQVAANRRALDAMATTSQAAADFNEEVRPLFHIPKARDPRSTNIDAVHRKRQGPSEHQEQTAVIKWWALQHQHYGIPHFALFAIPNGGARDPITGSRLRDEGVRRGALDLMLAYPSGKLSGLFIEMKVGYNKPTDEQAVMIEYLNRVGYRASVHWTAESAIVAIQEYLE